MKGAVIPTQIEIHTKAVQHMPSDFPIELIHPHLFPAGLSAKNKINLLAATANISMKVLIQGASVVRKGPPTPHGRDKEQGCK